MVEKFKQYLLDNVEVVKLVEVHEMTDDIKSKQLEAGIKDMTHIVVVIFDFAYMALSINENKKTIKGWKKQVREINEGYQEVMKAKELEAKEESKSTK